MNHISSNTRIAQTCSRSAWPSLALQTLLQVKWRQHFTCLPHFLQIQSNRTHVSHIENFIILIFSKYYCDVKAIWMRLVAHAAHMREINNKCRIWITNFFNERDILKYLALDKIIVTKGFITKRVEIGALIDLLHDRDHCWVLVNTDVNSWSVYKAQTS